MHSMRIAERLTRRGAAQRKHESRCWPGRSTSRRSCRLEEEALRIFNAPEHRTKAGTKKFYNTINQQLDRTIFGECSSFLNYGYVEDGAPQMSNVELPSQTLSRSSVKLVLELIGDCDLAGKRVLDVGCGRGGTLLVVNQFFRAKSKAGLDLSSAEIAHCRKKLDKVDWRQSWPGHAGRESQSQWDVGPWRTPASHNPSQRRCPARDSVCR